jgi:hypothetical protein
MALSVVIPPLESVRLVGPRASDYCCCKTVGNEYENTICDGNQLPAKMG